MGHGRAQSAQFKLGGDRDGHVKSLYVRLLQDSGAYPSIGAILPTLTRLMASGVYAIPNIQVRFDSVATNTTPTAAVRGAGRPEATQLLERAMDLFAADVGLDPAEVRRRNFIAADQFPYTTAVGATYDVGGLPPGAGHGSGDGRLRRAARRAGAPAGRGRSPDAGDRAQLLRGDHQRHRPRASSAPSRSRRRAMRSSRPGRSRTARATRRRSPRSPPSSWACRWSASRSSRATPTRWRAAPGPTAPSRRRSAARRRGRPPRSWWRRPRSWPPSSWRPTRTTWCWSSARGCSTSPGPPARRWTGRSWPAPCRRPDGWAS